MRGDSESVSKNTSNPIFQYPKYSNIRIFENSLASDLVFVYDSGYWIGLGFGLGPWFGSDIGAQELQK